MTFRLSAVCAFVVSATMASSVAAAADVESKTFDAATIKAIDIANGAGNVKIEAGETAAASVEKVKFGDGCKLTLEQQDDRVVVKVEMKKSFFSFFKSGSDCEANVTMTAPAAVDVKLRLGSGDATMTGLKGAVDFESGSGNVTINSEVSKLAGKTGSGEVKVKGLTGSDVDVKVGSGEIDLAWTKTPEKGSVSLTSGSGDITVGLPADAKLRTSLKSGSGDVVNEFGNSPDAPFDVSATVGSGDLTIRKL